MRGVKPFVAFVAAVVLLFAASGVASAGQFSPAGSSGSVPAGTAPQTVALAGPSGTIDSSTASFSFSSSESGSTFLCSLDGAGASACSSPKTVQHLADGPHAFQVWAVGLDGVQDPTGVMWTFTVQIPPPRTLAISGPSGTVDSSTASFSFSSSESSSSFLCSLDGASASACSSPKTVRGLADGQHAFQVWAVGADGQSDPTGVMWTFTVQTPPPRTMAISGPSGTIYVSRATFTFSSSESGGRFLCSVDSASASACVPPLTVQHLADGPHTFQAWAVGPDSEQDPTGVTWTFSVLTAPHADRPPSVSALSVEVGQTVTCDPGSWSGQPTVNYRWYSGAGTGGTPITGPQPSGAYTPQRSDAGREITCSVLATNAAGQNEWAATAVHVGQFALLADLAFPTSLPAAHPRSLPTLSFLSSNSGQLQVKLIACRRGCHSRRRRAMASKTFSLDTGLNNLRLPPAWRRKLNAGHYQLALDASTPYGDQQTTMPLNVTSGPDSPPISPSPAGRSSAQLPPGAIWALNQNQRAFAVRLAEDTGLDGGVVAAWVMSEEPASASSAPNGANNWLNIGCFDAGHWGGGGNSAWGTPTGGADATSGWLHGNPLPGVGYAAGGIRDILHAAGAPPADQIMAIQRSPWASSHYPNLGSIYLELQG